jgi:hypothetical protein
VENDQQKTIGKIAEAHEVWNNTVYTTPPGSEVLQEVGQVDAHNYWTRR